MQTLSALWAPLYIKQTQYKSQAIVLNLAQPLVTIARGHKMKLGHLSGIRILETIWHPVAQGPFREVHLGAMGVLSSRRYCPLTSLQNQHSCVDENNLPQIHWDQDIYTHPGISPDSFHEVYLFIQLQIPEGSHQKVNSEKGQGFFLPF